MTDFEEFSASSSHLLLPRAPLEKLGTGKVDSAAKHASEVGDALVEAKVGDLVHDRGILKMLPVRDWIGEPDKAPAPGRGRSSIRWQWDRGGQ